MLAEPAGERYQPAPSVTALPRPGAIWARRQATGRRDPASGERHTPRVPGFSVLVVCTANLCRSPSAAAMLRAGLPPGSGVAVTSAGTSATPGQEVPPLLVRELARRGVDVADHRSRQLSAEQVSAADLVLVATRAHRAVVVGAVPGALRRTFTLREMARLLTSPTSPRWSAAGALAAPHDGAPSTDDEDEDGEVARWAALAPAAAARRGAAVAQGEDDLADPYGRSARAYRNSVAEVERAAQVVLAAAQAPGLSLRGR